jgi:2-succinyl-5-enolpyruvyl-6-hydroxy-3-cyclohexene-1-carboxylate synthase
VNAGNEDDLRPELLITFGGAVVSKRIKTLLRKWRPAQHWNVDAGQRHHDTYQSLTHDIAVGPEIFFAQITGPLLAAEVRGESFYGEAWRMVDEHTRGLHQRLVADAPFCDLSVFNTLIQRMPANSDVHLANSTPARYAAALRPRSRHPLVRKPRHQRHRRMHQHRRRCAPTPRAGSPPSSPVTRPSATTAMPSGTTIFQPQLKVIVIDNGGGNIFRYIEGPDQDPALLHWFEAPHGRSIEKLVKSFDLPYHHAGDQASLEVGIEKLYAANTASSRLGGNKPAVLHITTDALTSPKRLRDHFAQLRTS